MRAPALAVVAALALALAACGNDKGGGGPLGMGSSSGPVGTWVIDLDRSLDTATARAQKEIDSQREQLAKLPEATRKAIEASIPKDAAALRKMVKEKMGEIQVEMTLNADHTAKAHGDKGGDVEDMTGTWEMKGDKVVITPKMSNGKPASGADAKEQTLVFKDGRLIMADDDGTEMFALKRK
jgi:hypothetical protein